MGERHHRYVNFGTMAAAVRVAEDRHQFRKDIWAAKKKRELVHRHTFPPKCLRVKMILFQPYLKNHNTSFAIRQEAPLSVAEPLSRLVVLRRHWLFYRVRKKMSVMREKHSLVFLGWGGVGVDKHSSVPPGRCHWRIPHFLLQRSNSHIFICRTTLQFWR